MIKTVALAGALVAAIMAEDTTAGEWNAETFCKLLPTQRSDLVLSCTADGDEISMRLNMPLSGIFALHVSNEVRSHVCPEIQRQAPDGGPKKMTVYDITGQPIAICQASP